MVAGRTNRFKPVRRKKGRKKVTTYIYEWLDANYVETRQEKENLLKSVQEACESGQFSTKRKGFALFVEGGSDLILQLVSERARFAFIREVEGIEVARDLEEEC